MSKVYTISTATKPVVRAIEVYVEAQRTAEACGDKEKRFEAIKSRKNLEASKHEIESHPFNAIRIGAAR